MNKKFRVEVTQKHINKAKEFLSKLGMDTAYYRRAMCPVARALKDTTNEFWTVTGTSVLKDQLVCAELSTEVRDFIADFDDGKNVEPFEFEIEIG